MYLSDLINQLNNAHDTIGGDSRVLIHYHDKEVILSSVSARIIDIDEYEIVLE